MSRLYPYFLMCWKKGGLTISQLDTAVIKNYITADEKVAIESTAQDVQ